MRPRLPKIHVSEPARLPTRFGTWTVLAFHSAAHRGRAEETSLALVIGDVTGGTDVLTRVHSECLTSEVFGSLKCDCADQLHESMRLIKRAGRGVIVYLRQEGRGIGIFSKIRAYHLQDHGLDTVQANLRLGLPQDSREYSAAGAILRHLGLKSVRLLTNNPRKVRGLKAVGVRVAKRLPLEVAPRAANREYLRTKRRKMGHLLRRAR